MAVEAVDVLQARVAILERRLQFVADELSGALARLAPATGDGGGHFDGAAEFDADSLSQFAQGFYEREYDEAGDLFRWTGNGPLCELRFHLDRGEDRPFRMKVGKTPPEVVAKLNGFVDYAAVPLAVEQHDDDLYVVGLLPKRSHTRLAIVTFLLGKAAPKKKAKVEDDHWLGFRFYSFHAA